MYGGIGESVRLLFLALFALVPFGLWKVVEIFYWLWTHVHFGAKP